MIIKVTLLDPCKLQVELFEYSMEDFDTGIDDIDDIEVLDDTQGGTNPYADNDVIETEADTSIVDDISDTDPFGSF